MNFCALRSCFIDHLFFVSDFRQLPSGCLFKFFAFLFPMQPLRSVCFQRSRHWSKFVHQVFISMLRDNPQRTTCRSEVSFVWETAVPKRSGKGLSRFGRKSAATTRRGTGASEFSQKAEDEVEDGRDKSRVRREGRREIKHTDA